MRKLLIVITAIILIPLIGCGDDTTGPTEEENGWKKYTEGEFTFEWQIEDSINSIRVKLTAPTTGWIAIGFDPLTFMDESNLIIGFVNGDTVSIRDDYGTSAVTHDSDENLGGVDNVEAINGSESSTETIIEFRIPLNSGDEFDKALEEGLSYSIVFAYGANGADDFTSKHSWVGAAAIEL